MFAIIFLILSTIPEGYAPDPYSIFSQSDSVLSSISSIEYCFTFSGTGALSNIIPVLEGKTSLSFVSGLDHPLMDHRLERLMREGSIRNISVPSGYFAARDSVFFISNENSTVYTSSYNSAAREMFDFPPSSVMMEYVLSEPFIDEVLADSIAVLYPEEVDGVLCHAFHVFYGDNQENEAIWFIGIADLLPHAVERIGYYGTSSIAGGQLLELSNLCTDCSIPPRPSVPDDFTFTQWLSLLEPGTHAPSFFLADRSGFTVRSSDQEDKLLLLCFFSSWDSTSLSALGLLKSVMENYPQSVKPIGISILEAAEAGFRLNTLDTDFPILIFGEDTAHDYNVHTVPAVFLISKSSEILYSCAVVTDEATSDIVRLIESEIGI